MTAATLAVGDVLPSIEVAVTAERQRRYHAGAGVTADFGGLADVSILANDTIHATRPLNTDAFAVGLHLGQTLHQTAPIRLDERLVCEGGLVDERPAARGRHLTFRFQFRRPDGTVPLVSDIMSLRVDKAAMRAAQPPAPFEFDQAGFETIHRFQLTPELVGAYSFEFPDYLVHFDMAVANGIGLRVPVAQGLMSLTWMLAALAEGGVPRELDMSAEFRRSIFWDEQVAVRRHGDRLLIAGGDGTVRSTGRVERVAR